MNKLYAKIVASFLLFISITGLAWAQKPLVTTASKAQLDRLTVQLSTASAETQQKAETLAPLKNWVRFKRTRRGDTYALRRITTSGFPIFYRTFNNTTAAATTHTNDVQAGGSLGLNLSGSSSFLNGKLAIWDGGLVFAGHQEFAGKTITARNTGSTDQHATHVAGTMIAKGVYAPARGMAYNANTLLSYDFNNDVAEISTAAPNLLLSNHSYGDISGWDYDSDNDRWTWYGLPGDTVDYKFGYYNTDAQNIDRITHAAPYYLIVNSAGNSRGYPGPGVGQTYYGYTSRTDSKIIEKGPRPANISSNTGYDIIPGFANAKNVLTVGAINQLPYGPVTRQDVTVSYFSSIGPTDDGRIKPDICGDGDALLSTSNTGPEAYIQLSGTSMAAPNVTGSLYLLQEYFAQKNGGNFMRSATLKALVCHTAFDAGNAGPDYIFGWGVLDTRRAAQAITDRGGASQISESILQQGQTETIQVTASGNGALAATIAWTDPEAEVLPEGTINNRTPKLINDLDIRISDGANTISPWVLNFVTPGANATRGDNIRDNVEQVLIENAIPGKTYIITITHKRTLTGGSQPYSLIVTGVGGAAYCASAPASNADSRIDNVTLANINNTPAAGCTTYSNYTSQTVQLEQGRTYPLSIRLGTCGGNFNKIAKVFIDWNGDGTLNETDELVASTNVINATGTYVTNITVPSTVTPDNYSLMRVVLVETADAAAVKPCGTYAKGETQDYRVQFAKAAVDVGAIAVNTSSVGGVCAGTTNLTVRLKNYGTQSVSNIPVTVTITASNGQIVTISGTYAGTLTPLAEDDFTLSGTFNSVAGRTYTVTATTNLNNDVVAVNNSVSSSIAIGSTPAAANLSANYCQDTNRYLLNGSGDGQLLWYTTPTGGVPVATGTNAFAIATPTNNTFYAGINDFNANVGPANKNALTGGGSYNQFTTAVEVSTKIPVLIKSARLYIGNSGRIIFTVTNSGGQIVSRATLNVRATRNVPGPGAQTDDPLDAGQVYNLNLLLPEEGVYTINISYANGATIFRNNTGSLPNGYAYPFKAGDIFSILSNDATSGSNTSYYRNFYYYFYDMNVVSAGCASTSRQAVQVTNPAITQNGTTLTSSFAANNQWYLNGEPIAGATGQTYNPVQSGNYEVRSLLATGCTAVSPVYAYVKADAVVNMPSDINLSAFPVPASTELNISFKVTAPNDVVLYLINSAGQAVYTRKSATQGVQYADKINVSNMAPGTYVLRLLVGQKVYSTKIIIAR